MTVYFIKIIKLVFSQFQFLFFTFWKILAKFDIDSQIEQTNLSYVFRICSESCAKDQTLVLAVRQNKVTAVRMNIEHT